MNALERLKEYAIFTIGAPVVLGLWVVCSLIVTFSDIEFDRGDEG